MMKVQTELDKAAVLASSSGRMAAYKDPAARLLSVLEIQAELEWMKPEAIQEALGIMKKVPDLMQHWRINASVNYFKTKVDADEPGCECRQNVDG